MKNILLASADAAACRKLRTFFESGYHLRSVSDFRAMLTALGEKEYEFLFLDTELAWPDSPANGDIRSRLVEIWDAAPSIRIIILTGQDRIRPAVEAVKAGADNYLVHPLSEEETKYVLDSIFEVDKLESELDFLRDTFWREDAAKFIRCRSAAMLEVFELVKQVARTNALVLLQGESGVGKTLVARLIHNHSRRHTKPFVSVHCGAIPDSLVESELFGHEKGAFTGAVKKRLGKFEIAGEGTILLDEIGTLSASAQVKLLQVLQDKFFQRVGGESELPAECRIIAATNADLKRMTEIGTFRSDLYFRLNVFPVTIPPLRERREDIPILVETFLNRLNREYGKNIGQVHPLLLKSLQGYHWPGNVRELENLVERAYIIEKSRILTPESFPHEVIAADTPVSTIVLDTGVSLSEFRNKAKENAERQYLKEILFQQKGRIDSAAAHAGITTRQLHKLLTKYGIDKKDYK